MTIKNFIFIVIYRVNQQRKHRRDAEVSMKKRLASVLILPLILISSATAQNWFKGTVDEAVAKSKQDGKMVLLDFFSDT